MTTTLIIDYTPYKYIILPYLSPPPHHTQIVLCHLLVECTTRCDTYASKLVIIAIAAFTILNYNAPSEGALYKCDDNNL